MRQHQIICMSLPRSIMSEQRANIVLLDELRIRDKIRGLKALIHAAKHIQKIYLFIQVILFSLV